MTSAPHLLEALALGLVMSVDGFAAAVALGAMGQRRRYWQIAAVLGIFALVFPLVGMTAGGALFGTLAIVAEWIGILTLIALGVWTIATARRASMGSARVNHARPATAGPGILLLGASLSTDNFVIGFGVGLHGSGSWLVGPAAGMLTFAAVYAGLQAGRSGRRTWGTLATYAAGISLLFIALLLGLGVL
ncbi:manganese efflux pump MntP family protein [soil metagenome]